MYCFVQILLFTCIDIGEESGCSLVTKKNGLTCQRMNENRNLKPQPVLVGQTSEQLSSMVLVS